MCMCDAFNLYYYCSSALTLWGSGGRLSVGQQPAPHSLMLNYYGYAGLTVGYFSLCKHFKIRHKRAPRKWTCVMWTGHAQTIMVMTTAHSDNVDDNDDDAKPVCCGCRDRKKTTIKFNHVNDNNNNNIPWVYNMHDRLDRKPYNRTMPAFNATKLSEKVFFSFPPYIDLILKCIFGANCLVMLVNRPHGTRRNQLV